MLLEKLYISAKFVTPFLCERYKTNWKFYLVCFMDLITSLNSFFSMVFGNL